MYKGLLVFLFALFTHALFAQTSTDPIGNLELSCKVVDENKRGLLSQIFVYEDSTLIEQFETNKIGKFAMSIPLNRVLSLVVMAPGYISKTIWIDAQVPEGRELPNYSFPCFFDLYPVGRVPSYVDLKRPVGKIKYSAGQFIYDLEFTKDANKKLREFVKERRNLKIRKLESTK